VICVRIAETNWTRFVISGVQNRTFGSYLRGMSGTANPLLELVGKEANFDLVPKYEKFEGPPHCLFLGLDLRGLWG
jgi:hypothetical protein